MLKAASTKPDYCSPHIRALTLKIAFIGCGNMARSLIGGLIANGFPATDIVVADPYTESTDAAANKWNIVVAENNGQAISTADVVVLAVKPQQMKSVLTDAVEQLDSQLLVSVAAGILTEDMQKWGNADNNNIAIVRCMPNTPALLQSGATALYADHKVTQDQRIIAEDILNAVGITAWVANESQLDAITALSGSGPAYFFLMIEAMTEAALEMGLEKDLAVQFATQTALGAARMAKESELEPAQLRKNVTSPAGTTEAALNSFKKDNLKQIVSRAMSAADGRAQELGKELGDSHG